VSIPSREDAARILLELRAPPWLLDHSAAVAEVAAFLVARLREHGRELPVDLAETAALLHDVDKTPPLRALRSALGHGTAGASWLAGRGYAELGPAVAGHPASRLADNHEFDRWLREAPLAEQVVAYADKRAMSDVVPLAERFAAWQVKHPEQADEIGHGRRLAEHLEREICTAAGLAPAEVRRLAWVAAALAET
jgi:putative nucleotidyltransferase with HDIG domain